MPSAPDNLVNYVSVLLGYPDGLDFAAQHYLQDAGYVLDRSWHWKPKPGISSYDEMTQDEYNCLLYLVLEWDFGGILDFDNSP